VHGHHVVVGFHPTHFRIHAGEFGGVAGGERWICPEGGGNLKDRAKARGLGHLLEKLGALGKIGGGVEILHLEQLCARFTSTGHQFGGVDFDPVVTNPPATHSVLESRLSPENQVRVRPAQIEEAPVHPLVDRRVFGDGRFLFSHPCDLEGGNFHFKPAQLYSFIKLQIPFNEDEGATGECRNRVGQCATLRLRSSVLVLGAKSWVDQLNRA